LSFIAVPLGVLVWLALAYDLQTIQGEWPWTVTGSTLLMATAAVAWLLARRGRITLGGFILTTVFWLIITVTTYFGAGLYETASGGYLLTVVMAGVFLGKVGALVFTLLNALALVGVYVISLVIGPPSIEPSVHPFTLIVPLSMLSMGFMLVRFSVKSVEEGLARAHSHRRTLSQANRALSQYSQELEARNAELDTFVHTMAHDLRNYLAILILSNSFLQDDKYRLSASQRRAYEEKINAGLRRMNAVVESLLLFARVREQKKVKAHPMKMEAIVKEALRRAQDSTDYPTDEVEVRLPESWPTALGYAPWVEEVWVNYLSNAIHRAGHPPHVEVGASPTPFSAGSGLAQARFWVRDNGPGLSPERRAQLFAPFKVLEEENSDGLGLGLCVSRRIVQRLGGEVGVESEEGRGTTLWFTLPQCEKQPRMDKERRDEVDT
jgi:signal transduction histidine kinase